MRSSQDRRLGRPLVLSALAHIAVFAALALTQSETAAPGRRPPARIQIVAQEASSPATASCPDMRVLPEPVAPVPLAETRVFDEAAEQLPEAPQARDAHHPQRVLPERAWATARILAKRTEPQDAPAEQTSHLAPPSPPATSVTETHQPAATKVLTPVPGTNLPPNYPRIARRRGYEGTVLLRVSCDARGRVTSVAVASSSGHRCLDEAASAAVRAWRYEHGPGVIEQPFAFELRS